MQGRRSRAISRWWSGAAVLLVALAACSSTTTHTSPSARDLVGRLVDAKVCTRPRASSPEPGSWSCTLPTATAADRSYVSVRAFASPAELTRSVARARPRCPSTVVVRYLRGPAWLAVVAPRTRPNVARVRRALGGHDLVLDCGHRVETTHAPGTTTTTLGATSSTTAAPAGASGPRSTSPTTAYLPPVHVPAPPPAAPHIDVPPPTPAITAPPGWQPPPTDPPGTIHASGRASDLPAEVRRRDAADGAAGAPPEGWDR